MANNKFDILANANAVEVVDAAALKESTQEVKKDYVNLNVTKFPKDLWDAIKASGEPVNTFIKRAAKRVAKQEELM